MDESISASDASRKFLRILRHVREGRSYLVTSHGQPIARIVPVGRSTDPAPGGQAALLDRLERQRAADVDGWTRDELYEDED